MITTNWCTNPHMVPDLMKNSSVPCTLLVLYDISINTRTCIMLGHWDNHSRVAQGLMVGQSHKQLNSDEYNACKIIPHWMGLAKSRGGIQHQGVYYHTWSPDLDGYYSLGPKTDSEITRGTNRFNIWRLSKYLTDSKAMKKKLVMVSQEVLINSHSETGTSQHLRNVVEVSGMVKPTINT